MRRQTGAKGEAGAPGPSITPPGASGTPRGQLPAAGSGRDVLGRLRTTVESIRHQMAARRRNRAKAGQ
jgi:hypothetical protein